MDVRDHMLCPTPCKFKKKRIFVGSGALLYADDAAREDNAELCQDKSVTTN